MAPPVPLRLVRNATQAPLVSAHRGALRSAPENTILAFEQAVQQGAHMIELDVHPTRDRELVILHDVSTQRTTGQSALVEQLTLAQVLELDAGSWYSPRFAGARIPTLHEVLEWANHRAYLNLDIRNYPFFDFYDTSWMADTLSGLLDRLGATRQVVVQCADHVLAHELRIRNDELIIGLTQHGRPLDTAGLATAAGANLLGLDPEFLTPGTVESAHAMGVAVMTSVEVRLPGVITPPPESTHDAIGRLLDMRVDVLVTDDVQTTLASIREFGGVRADAQAG